MPNLPLARVLELLNQQIVAADEMLTHSGFVQLSYDQWKLTSESVLVRGFGSDSRNCKAFEAAVAFPGSILVRDPNAPDVVKYRRDTLLAKKTVLMSCVEQLELGLTDEAEPSTTSRSEVHPYLAARKVLEVLHKAYLKEGHLLWSISPTKDGFNNFEEVGLAPDQSEKALGLLCTKGLALKVTLGPNYRITEKGVSAFDHPGTLDYELPLGQRTSPSETREETFKPQDLTALHEIAELVRGKELSAILERDLGELARARESGLTKTTILLSGSILEAILVDILDRNPPIAASYMPKRKFPNDASLGDLVRIAGSPTLMDPLSPLLTNTSVAMANAITEHRDLIHPHAELRSRIVVDIHTAQAMVHLLTLVVRDLTAAKERGDIAAYEKK